MNYQDAYALIVLQIASFSASAFVVLSAVLGVGVGLLVFRFGWRSLMNMPDGAGYDPTKGSGMSRFFKRKNVRSASGSINLLG